MINKQNLWFATLFSLILILGIYYLSIGDDVSSVLNTNTNSDNTNEVVEITEEDALVALEVENDTEKQTMLDEYQNILLDGESSTEEKNDAYEKIQKINSSSKDEEKIKQLVKENFKLDSVTKISEDTITINVTKGDASVKLANDIIRNVQSLYEEEKYITVKFN